MDIVIPPSVGEALLGGGLLSLATMAVIEWLKSREWFPLKQGDVLIVVSVGVAVLLSTLFWALNWVEPTASLPEALGFGVASGLGASVLRDVFANVLQSRQQVQIIEVRGDVNEAELATALKAVGGSDPVEAE